MTISVVVPTYRRVMDLERCLRALEQQTRPADQVIVVVRADDHGTQEFLSSFSYDQSTLPLQTVWVNMQGVVAAMNSGLQKAWGNIMALTDDDAAPHSDWLERIERHFDAPEVGGVGGRDWLHMGTHLWDESRPVVGKVQWWGRMIGEHHFGVGGPRQVDFLKGVNCAYRTRALRKVGFDTRLLGSGAQVHWELSLGFALNRAGWKLVYDPAVAVDHYQGTRYDEDQRNAFNALAMHNAVHNETLSLLDYLPNGRRYVYLLWSLLIGTRGSPGIIQVARLGIARDPHFLRKGYASLRGRWHGWKSFVQYRHPPVTSCL